MRLLHLEGRVKQCAHPQMYAGVAMQGAADATHQALADIELMTMEGTEAARIQDVGACRNAASGSLGI